jgi:hypothetical protein
MKMSAEEYGRRVRRVGPPSPLGGDPVLDHYKVPDCIYPHVMVRIQVAVLFLDRFPVFFCCVLPQVPMDWEVDRN